MDEPIASDLPGLDRHLSVVRAGADATRALLASVRAPAVGTTIDLTATPMRIVSIDDLAESVRRHSERRDENRRRDRARVEGERRVAQVRHERARATQQHLLERGRRLDEAVAFTADAIDRLERFAEESAGTLVELEKAKEDRSAAREALDHLARQREHAGSAMAQASDQLGALGVAHFDEPGLRRELESGTSALGAAQAEIVGLRARMDDLERRRGAIDSALAEIATERAELERSRDEWAGPDAARLAELAAALAAYDDEASFAHLDGRAADLHDLLDRIEGELAQVEIPSGPNPIELAAARADLDAALATLREADHGADRISPADRARIEAAHDAVLAAQEGRGRGALQRLSAAQEVESALLDELGFASHLEVVLSGGRRADAAARSLANQHRAAQALARVEALEEAATPSPEVARLLDQRDAAVTEAARLLRVEPGDDARSLLAGHRAVDDFVVDRLRETLTAAGGRAEGERLETAARRVLAEAELEVRRRGELEARLGRLDDRADELDRRSGELGSELAATAADLRDATDRESAARRALSGLEGELATRSGEDAQRLHRVAAAEQLRAQVDALGRALDEAEDAARARLADAEQRCRVGEELARGFDKVVSDATRRAREVADELAPGTVRGSQDPIGELYDLARSLSALVDQHGIALAPAEADLERCAADLADVDADLAGLADAATGPHPDDRVAGLADVLTAAGRSLVVLVEPFADADDEVHDRLAKTVVQAAAERPVLLLTEDPRTLGWAIGLPGSEGAVVALDAVTAALTPSYSSSTNGPSLTVAPVGSPGRTDS